MSTVKQVLAELKKKGDPRRISAYGPHGAPDDIYGVSVADMKTMAKKLRGEHELALGLYATGNGDAQYLAGMLADGSRMTKRELDTWARKSSWPMVAEYAVPGVACESEHARDLALKWIRAKKESVASTGWCTYAGLVAVRPDEELDLEEIEVLLDEVVEKIDSAPNRVRYTMNGFVIAVGSYVTPLQKRAKRAAKKLGKVEVDMGGKSCKVPLATEYIAKVEKAGRAGKKRKTVRC
jgi:3-methyladenine DNA glycosylase AlkD